MLPCTARTRSHVFSVCVILSFNYIVIETAFDWQILICFVIELSLSSCAWLCMCVYMCVCACFFVVLSLKP